MKLKKYILLFISFFLSNAYSQPILDWSSIDSLNSELPPGISIYKASGRINGDTVTAFYSITDIKNHDLVFYPLYSETNQKPEKYFEESPEDIVLLTNGGYFGTNVSYSLVLNNFQTIAPNIRAVTRSHDNNNYTYYPIRSAFGVNSGLQPEASYVYTFSHNNITYSYPEPSPNTTEDLPLPQPTPDYPEGGEPWRVSEAIGGGPMLIIDSVINYNYTPELFPDDITASIAPRTAIGVTGKGEIINLVVDGRQNHSRGVSLEILSRILLEVGCVEAINLDGGGSSAMLVYDEVVNEPSDGNTRYIPSLVSIKKARVITNSSGDFVIQQNPVDSIDEGSFRKPETFVFGNGDIGSYFFNNILPAEYRLEFYHNNNSTFLYTEELEFILYTGGEAIDTIKVNQNLQSLDHFISLGNYQLGYSDSMVVSNNSTTGFAHIDVLRLIKTGSGLPDIDIISGNYYGDHSPGETIKFKIEARAVNGSRKISEFRVYEVIGENYRLLNENSFTPSLYYIDSVNYIIEEDPDQIRLKSVVYDELNDSSSVYYTINIDNTPPSVAIGKNSVLKGGTGDTLSFELKLLPANDLRPLDELRIYKNPATENLLLDSLTPDPEGDTIFFNYKLMVKDAPAINFRFLIRDSYGYEAYRDYSYFFTSVNRPGTSDLHSFYNREFRELIIQSAKNIAPDEMRVYIYDITGRLINQKHIFHAGRSVVKLYGVSQGTVVAKILYGNSVYHYRFIQGF